MRSGNFLLLASNGIAFILHNHRAESFPTGAGACTAGDLLSQDPAAVTAHGRDGAITGTLEDNGFSVLFDENILARGHPNSFAAIIPHTVKLAAPEEHIFRGFLIRIEDPKGRVDTFDYLSPVFGDSQAKVSEICTDNEETGGVTHTSNDEKTSIEAVLMTEFVESNFVSELIMDVTIVVENRGTVSEWYHTRYHLHSMSTPPTAIPTLLPTAPPTYKPTDAPSPKPTAIPTTKPIFLPNPL